MKLWDAIVVGAGPAGCACAYDLAAAGKAVLLLDKSEFPRVKACAGGLTMKTVRALRYSIEPVVREKIHRMVLEDRASRRVPVPSRKLICVMTERSELDAYCLAKTIEAGAVFRRAAGIEEIAQQKDFVSLRTAGEEMRARFLIGADGVHSRVRQLTEDASWFRSAFAIEANVPRASAGEDLVFDFSPVKAGYGWIFPKRDHMNIGLYSMDRGEKLDRSRLSAYIAQRFGPEATAEKFIGQYAGFGAQRHRVENERVFLAGDAGGFVDLLTGEGIYGAVISGQAAAAAVLLDLDRGTPARQAFIEATAGLRENLGIAERIAQSFYASPEGGFRAMKTPLLRATILRNYSEGLDLSSIVRMTRRILPAKNLTGKFF